MKTPDSAAAAATPESPGAGARNFSLILGGPLFQLLQRSRLSGCALELMRRRLIVMTLFAWLPLCVLALVEGNLWNRKVPVPFLYDVDVQVRFLLALPLLVVAELLVHLRFRPVVVQFLTRDLVPDEVKGKFDAALHSAVRLRNSVTAEVLLIVFVYVVGVFFIWRNHAALEVATWYGATVGGKWQPSLAGWWFGLVSLPFFQFLLLRWYYRIFIWARFLWQVSRLDLRLLPTHPDRCGGLGFLASITSALAPLLLAQGALLSGTIANQIFFDGARLPEFKFEIIAVTVFLLLLGIGPLLTFMPRLSRLKRAGLQEYGSLAQRYVDGFDRKWLRGAAPPEEPLLGSADVQSLADLNNSFEVIRSMRPVPFTKESLLQLAVPVLLPLLPLTLTLISPDEIIQRLLKVFF